MKVLTFTVDSLMSQTAEDMAPPDTVQLHNSRIDSRGRDKTRFGRWQPVMIINRTTGGFTVRHARGGAGRPGLTRNGIVLDYDAMVDLDWRKSQPNDIIVRPASWSEVLRYYYNSKNSLTRVSTRMAVLGTVLGIMGFIIGLLSFLAMFF